MKQRAQTDRSRIRGARPEDRQYPGDGRRIEFKNFKYGLNHVTQIQRQPGSAFKPFVYTVAIDNGYSPCLRDPEPAGHDHDGGREAVDSLEFRRRRSAARTTIREAIKHSINLVAVRAIEEIAPVKQVIDYAQRMGITSPLPPVRIARARRGRSLPAGNDRGVRRVCQPRRVRRAELDPEDRGQGRERDRGEHPPQRGKSSARRRHSS